MKKIKKIVLICFGIFFIIYFVNKFFYYYSFQSPIVIKFQSPITRKVYQPVKVIKVLITPATKSITTPKTEKEIILSKKHGDILWKVYGLESSWGRNDDCRNQGKYNGFGYGQNTYVWNCFNSFEEVVEKVNNWFEKRLKENGNDLTEAVCYYNTGLPKQVNCMYYQNFISL